MYVVKDPKGANLDRAQITKGWVDKQGKAHERIYDVVFSGYCVVNRQGVLIQAVGNTVDLKTGKYTNTIGVTEFTIVWTDHNFDPSVKAVYYVRAYAMNEIYAQKARTLCFLDKGDNAINNRLKVEIQDCNTTINSTNLTSSYFMKNWKLLKVLKNMVGETGFEPATLCSQNRCATRLRHSPIKSKNNVANHC